MKIQVNTIHLDNLSPEKLIFHLNNKLYETNYKDLFKGLSAASNSVLQTVIYRKAIRAKDIGQPLELSLETASRIAERMIHNRRKRFVNRIFRKYPLFAIQIIRERYPFYDEHQLQQDLSKNRPAKYTFRKKRYPSQFGLRKAQIQKLTYKFINGQLSEGEKSNLCNQIAVFQSALQKKSPVRLAVKYRRETRAYYFGWNEKESTIKKFVAAANSLNEFDQLDIYYKNLKFNI